MKKLLTILFSLFVVFSYAQIDLEKQTNITEQINNPDGIFKHIIYSTVDTTVTGDFTIPVANIVTITSFCDDGVDNTISLPTPVDSLKGNIVEVTHLEPSDDPNRTTTVETDGTSYHIYDNFTGDTLTFFNIYQSGQTVRFTLKEIEGVLRWVAVNLSPVVFGDKELTAVGKIRQGADGDLYAYDSSVSGERKLQYQYFADSVQEILGMNLELGDRVKVKSTGAEYLVQADEVSGFTTDDTVVVTLANGYARLMPQSGKIHLSHINESGIGLQKAIDYVEALITSGYEYGKTLKPNEIAPVPYSVLITSTVVIDREITVPDFVMLEGVTNNYTEKGNDQPGLIFNLNNSTKTGITFSSGNSSYSQAGGIRNLRLTPISESYAALNFINPNSKVVEHITITESNIDSAARFKFGIIIEGSVYQKFDDIRIDAVDSVGLYIKRNEFIGGTTLSFNKLSITGRGVSKHNLFIESNSNGAAVADIVFHDAAFESTTLSAIKITPYFGNIVFNNLYAEYSAQDKTEAIIEIGVGDTIGLIERYSSLTIHGGEISYRDGGASNDGSPDFAINADWVDNLSINGVYHNGQNEYYSLKTSENTKSVTLKDCMLFATYAAGNLGLNAASFHRNELDSVYDLSVVRMDNVLSINGAVKVPLNFIGNGTFFAPDMKTDTTFAIVALADDSTLAKVTYDALADTLNATNNTTENYIPYWNGDSWEDSNINRVHSSTNDGSNNVWFGYTTNAISNGINNTAFGYRSGFQTTSGNYNTLIGSNSGYDITTGSENVLIGADAGQNIATANANTIVGNSAGSNTTGAYNSILGRRCFLHNTSGQLNVAIGSSAGSNIVGGGNLTSADNSIFIGALSKAENVAQTNQIVIGFSAEGNGSNTTTIGATSTTDAYIYGNLNLPSSGAYASLADSLVANGLVDNIEAVTIDFGTNTTINTGVNDDITISHDLSTADINVQITIVGTTPYHYTVHSKTSTTFTVRFYDPDGTSLAGITDIDFDWIARK